MFGLLPPSSSVTRFNPSTAVRMISLPVAVCPVNATFRTPGCRTSAAPTSGPPITTFTTPGGNPASSTSCINRSVDRGASSDGLITIVQPAASAGPSL